MNIFHPDVTISVVLIVLLGAVMDYELREKIIPDFVTISGIIIGLALHYFLAPQRLLFAFIGVVVGFLLPYSIALLYSRIRGREGIGGGIIKLLAMIGAFLGWQGVIVTFVVGSVLGIVHGIVLVRRNQTGSIELGPHLVIGSLVYLALRATRVL